jgi:hypothetical protein
MVDDWLKPFPEPLEERISNKFKCYRYFDRFALCRGGKTQLKTMYESGEMKSCREEWEEFRWCIKAKYLGDTDSKKRLNVRRRNVYTTMDTLPWIYRKEYLEYLRDEHRLPKRLMYLVEEGQEVEEMDPPVPEEQQEPSFPSEQREQTANPSNNGWLQSLWRLFS